MQPMQTTNEEMQTTTDISGLEDIDARYEGSPTKRYVKLIPQNKTIDIATFQQMAYFVHIGDVVLDKEISHSGKNEGKKKETH